jgi:hypothetical protein
MFTREQEEQFQQIFEELGKSLDITPEQHMAAVKSYEYLGSWLDRDESPLKPLRPVISPQGSFLLGTPIRPVNEDDDFDVDLVLRLMGKPDYWTQKLLKEAVGRELRAHGTFLRQLQPEGKRCWTLKHADGAKFHMDILPAIARPAFSQILNKSLTAEEARQAEDLVFAITDTTVPNYATGLSTITWPQSNPFGYAIWFQDRASVAIVKAKLMSEAVKPLPKYQRDKLPLQRIVQILKRHRDILFNGDEDKPISIIITTLAALAYEKETNILRGLANVLDRFEKFIEDRYDPKRGRMVKWIANPVNAAENFADRWPDQPQREQNFYQWLAQVRKDIKNATGQRGSHLIHEGLRAPFGAKAVDRAFSAIAVQANGDRLAGKTRMAAGTGMLGAAGATPLTNHTNYGTGD